MIRLTLEVAGEDWFVDLEAGELRAVKDPATIVQFAEMTEAMLDELYDACLARISECEELQEIITDLWSLEADKENPDINKNWSGHMPTA